MVCLGAVLRRKVEGAHVNDDMRILQSRVDKLVTAHRVRLSVELVEHLRALGKKARAYGRAAFKWGVMVPKDAPDRASFRRLGPVKAMWVEDELMPGVSTHAESERRTLVWGELGWSAGGRRYVITNEPHFILVIDESAPGGDVGKRAPAGGEAKAHNVQTVHDKSERRRQIEKALDEKAEESFDRDGEPGFTVEITWYADALARRGIEACLKEGQAIAALLGDVREARLRRIDLCADVLGMAFGADDLGRLVKRPKAGWALDYADDSWTCGICSDRETPCKGCARELRRREKEGDSRASFGRGAGPGKLARVTGLSVGRGGDVMMRIYDKREELARSDDRAAERREREETIWHGAGCGPIGPEARVTRVEFQLRGEALRDMGLRDPDCMWETFREPGTKRKAQKIATIMVDPKTKKMRQATLVDWLDRIWMTCLDWCRLVVPRVTKKGKPVQGSLLDDDARWQLLRTVRFTDRAAFPIVRYRARSAASAAQALGVALSQAAREGQLPEEWSDKDVVYRELCEPKTLLRQRVLQLKLDEVDRIVEWLIEKFGEDAIRANVFLAERANAKRARYMRAQDRIEPRTRRRVGEMPALRDGIVWIGRKTAA